MTWEELIALPTIITLEEFEGWVHNYDNGDLIGTRSEPCDCPVAIAIRALVDMPPGCTIYVYTYRTLIERDGDCHQWANGPGLSNVIQTIDMLPDDMILAGKVKPFLSPAA